MKNKGFMLIEVIIYIALFSIIMGGLVITVYLLTQNASSLQSKGVSQEEINFVLKKIEWALAGASDIDVPSDTTVKITNQNFSDSTIVFQFNDKDNQIGFCQTSTNSCTHFTPLTTKNVKVESLVFAKINSNPHTPPGVSMNLNIDGIFITYIAYLRI